MRVWVLIGNDYPAAVFEDEAQAQQVLTRCQQLAKTHERAFYPHVFWRLYEFETGVAPLEAGPP